MKQPKKPVTVETVEEGIPELAVYVKTTSFVGKPVEKLELSVPVQKGEPE